MKLITTNVALIAVLRCSYWVTHEGLQQIIECMIISEWWVGLCLVWVDGLEGMRWAVGCRYSPVNGAAGPLIRRPGAPGFQISTHAHVCTKEQPENFELCSAVHSLHNTHFYHTTPHAQQTATAIRPRVWVEITQHVSKHVSTIKTPVATMKAQHECKCSQVCKLHA